MTRENAQKSSSLAVIALVGALGSIAGALLSSTEIAGRLMRPQIVIVADERMGAIMRERGPEMFVTRSEWNPHLETFRELRSDVKSIGDEVGAQGELIRQQSELIRQLTNAIKAENEGRGFSEQPIIRAATALERALMAFDASTTRSHS